MSQMKIHLRIINFLNSMKIVLMIIKKYLVETNQWEIILPPILGVMMMNNKILKNNNFTLLITMKTRFNKMPH
jgi:hypothetical protein